MFSSATNVIARNDYYAFGKRHASGILPAGNDASNRWLYNGKERQVTGSLGFLDYGARMYDPEIVRWFNTDPLAEKYYSWSQYVYALNSPVNLVDLDGLEPIKPKTGTTETFVALLNNSPRGVGTYIGQRAGDYLSSLGNTEFSRTQMRPLPTETGFFNNKEGRYIYTEIGGWIDMSHFMFYAGKAYCNKLDDKKNPIGEALQYGYAQEFSDQFAAPHSAYSYEDLPSDKFGAEFGAKYFDPNSKQTLGEQLGNYLNNVLGATEPQNAPNYNQLPTEEPTKKPSLINKTTNPFYTEENQ